jgi:hypothetical protein
VTTCKMVKEECTKQVPTCVCTMQTCTVQKCVPTTVCKQVPYTVCVKVPYTVTEMVPTTVCKKVPVCQEYTVCVKKPRYVPCAEQAACPTNCGCDNACERHPIRDWLSSFFARRMACDSGCGCSTCGK